MRTTGRVTRMRRVACAAAMLAAMMWAGAQTAKAQSDSVASNPSAPPSTERAMPPRIDIAFFRAHDSRGLNVFEAPKEEGVAYDGFRIQWGAAFTQQFQGLRHENTAAPNIVGGVNQNQLITIGSGFNNA